MIEAIWGALGGARTHTCCFAVRCRADPARTRLHSSAALRRSLTDWPSIRSARRPSSGRLADLPLVAEGIDDPADAPAVLVGDRGGFGRAGRKSLRQQPVGIVDDEQGAARATTDRLRAEPPMRGRAEATQKDASPNGELRDDAVAVADTMEHARAEGSRVEPNRLTSALDPQLGLDAVIARILRDRRDGRADSGCHSQPAIGYGGATRLQCTLWCQGLDLESAGSA